MLFVTGKSPSASAKLAELELFAHCTPRQLRRIDQLCSAANVGASHVLCLQGAPARQCFVVVDGRAEVTIGGRCVATIEHGQLIGEIALIAPGGRRTATVTAATDMNLLVFTTGEFLSLVEAVRPLAHAILRESTRRLVANANSPQTDR